MAISKDIVQKYIDSTLKSEVLEDSLMPFTLSRRDDLKSNGFSCPDKGVLLSISTSSEPNVIIGHYVNLMMLVKSTAKFNVLFDMLRLLIQQHPHLAKVVCEALLHVDPNTKEPRLDYYNQNAWMRSFSLVTEILPNVDYKSVRDILKANLDIIYSLPTRFDIAIIPQLDTLYANFSMILDREACLMPAYLSLDEIQKKIAVSRPVWKFSDLFYHFIESFKPTAQIFSIINRPDLLPVVGLCSTCPGNASGWQWRLDAISAKIQLKGLLPYKGKLKEPQVGQIRYLLEQPYSREMICTILAIGSKPPPQLRPDLIEQIAVSLVLLMDKSESSIDLYNDVHAGSSEHLFLWINSANNIVFYVAPTYFGHLVNSICEKISARNHRRGSELLMWAILQAITGSSKSAASDFVSVGKLFDLLYSGREQIPVPPENAPTSPFILAAASVWMQIVKRAELEEIRYLKPLPASLQLHYEYLTSLKSSEGAMSRLDFSDVVALNAHSSITTKNNFHAGNFVDYLSKLPSKQDPSQPIPIPVHVLDTLTTHSKTTLLAAIVQKIMAIAQNKPGVQSGYHLTPALIETFGRLMIYTDAEAAGIKWFISHIMGGGAQAFWRSPVWPIYHVLLEMYNHRVYHVPVQCRYQMLLSLRNISPMVYGANQTRMQLSMTIEVAELKILLGLTSHEALNIPLNPRHTNDPKAVKHLINSDSEELNKVLVLVLARSAQITSSEQAAASLIEEILKDINTVMPISWSQTTMSFFPSIIKDWYARNTVVKETERAQLRPAVEEEYRKWLAMANENTQQAHFSQPNAPPLFICVLWRIVLSNGTLSPVVYRILDSIRIRSIFAHLRTFVDYLVHEFSRSVVGQDVNKYADALNDLIWKYHIISLDRLILCMCLRSFNVCETQVCFFIIQVLLIKKSDFKARVQTFCKLQSPEHWKQDAKSCEANTQFHREYPERYFHDFLDENSMKAMGQTLPSLFSNICLRFIPVCDVLIHRALELSIMSTNSPIKIDIFLNEYGCLYKFHDKPLTYLYNTLHYYDAQLPVQFKRILTSSILSALNEIRPPNWCLSELFLQYLNRSAELSRSGINSGQPPAEEWVPGEIYYRKIIGRLVDTLQNKNQFYHTDWRFNEFPNFKAHAIHATAIELMSLPVQPNVVGNAILDLVLNSYVHQDRSTIPQWMNAIGLIMAALPPSYHSVLGTKILEYMESPLLTNQIYAKDTLHLINFCDSHEWMYESQISYLVALTHAMWHHSNQIFCMPAFWKSAEIKQAVETESQFLFVCCLIGPFLARYERSRVLMDLVVELYEMLAKVDRTSEIQHLDTISDFFYHIKYMFIGDSVKNEIERCIKNLRPRLQYCLRFITHLSVSSLVDGN